MIKVEKELTKKDLKTIILTLEWCVEGNYRGEKVGTGKTDTDAIFKVLDKLKKLK